MISNSWIFNWAGGILLALIATGALMEIKSSSLIPKSLLLWPPLVILLGVLSLSRSVLLGVILVLCGLQAALVNLRRLSPWPSGALWLGLALAGIHFQFLPLWEERLTGFLWMAIGITKVSRERSTSLETGTPVWIFLTFVQAILLASYR